MHLHSNHNFNAVGWPSTPSTSQPSSWLDKSTKNEEIFSDGQVTAPPPSRLGLDVSAYNSDGGAGGCCSMIPGDTTKIMDVLGYNHHVVPNGDSDTNGNSSCDDDGDDDGDVDFITQIARELSVMSVQERNTMYEEIHGIPKVTPEDPEFISKKLSELDTELKAIVNKNRHQRNVHSNYELDDHLEWSSLSPYEKSLRLNPDYAGGDKFRLMFLRGNKYDPKVAAQNIIIHFEWKHKLFATENDESILGRHIIMADLNDDDIQALRTCGSLLLPGTDMGGRRVFFFYVAGSIKMTQKDSQLRILMYQIIDALWRNEYQEQHLGVVMVAYTVGATFMDIRSIFTDINTLPIFRKSLPHRRVAVHFCYNNTTIKAIFNLQHRLFTNEMKLRFRDHCGTHMECQYELTSFGIPHSMLPVDEDGKLKHFIVDNYIESQRKKDARDGWILQTKTSSHPSPMASESPSLSEQLLQHGHRTMSIPSPPQKSNTNSLGNGPSKKNSMQCKTTFDDIDGVKPNDVLMGRGIPFQTHPGNLRLAKLIEEHATYHNKASRFEKVVLTWKLVNIIKDSGGRFLAEEKANGEGLPKWKEVDDPVARTKVSYGFRSLIKMKKEKRQKQQRSKQKNHK